MGEPRGLPQGLTTSDALATAYLSGVDAGMLRRGYYYWRHGDDIRLAVSDYDAGRRSLHDLEYELRNVRLLLNATKSRVLHRQTYERQLGVVDVERGRIQNALLRLKEKGVLEADQSDIEELTENAGIDEETRWGLFYHGNISLEEIIDQLRPLLEPNKIEIAAAMYDEAMRRSPDSGQGQALSGEIFHGLLSSSLTTLIAAASTRALDDAANLIARFPDETELIATYLRALAKTKTNRVMSEVMKAMTNGYLLGWQKTWLLIVLREVVAVGSTTSIDDVANLAAGIAQDESADWIARAEASRLLAECGRLTHELALRLWTGAPAPVRPEFAAAVAKVAALSTDNSTWAPIFLDSLKGDPLLQVVLQRTSQGGSQGS
jgi:hypothetical protein